MGIVPLYIEHFELCDTESEHSALHASDPFFLFGSLSSLFLCCSCSRLLFISCSPAQSLVLS
eukprot:m.95554 g.95554  ORF g.95554 m.95554 type:complete len:62 (+) comp51296_c0_seq6:230-415(+)